MYLLVLENPLSYYKATVTKQDRNCHNIKPSRFGKIENLLETIEYCRENGINMYAGGQFELGIGRQHIHALESIFYPDSRKTQHPNIQPEKIPENPPESPLRPKKNLKGLNWQSRQ